MSNVPNLDCLPAGELIGMALKYDRASRKEARELIGDSRPGYTRIVKNLACYAWNKSTAESCRLRGEIDAALLYEGICDRIYDGLPEDLKW